MAPGSAPNDAAVPNERDNGDVAVALEGAAPVVDGSGENNPDAIGAGRTDSAAPAGDASADSTATGGSDGATSSIDAGLGAPVDGSMDSARAIDDGSVDGAEVETDGAPQTTPPVCTSDMRWTGDGGAVTMSSGIPCVGCHSVFTIAGTVYPTAHEPDNCFGVKGVGLSLVITDAHGTVTSMPINGAGNFFSTVPIVAPYRAKVVSATSERDTIDPQSSGDCNSCHTVGGSNGAPGRVTSP